MERINSILIKSDISIKQALKKMDEAGKRILLVINTKNQLLGVVTDGDVRRWIIRGNSLDKGISKLMNKNPISLKEGYSKDEAKKIMLEHSVECIPVVAGNKKVVSAIWWLDLFSESSRSNKKIDAPVVIMAGGEGSRLAPFTGVLPKPLMPIGEKPIIELIINKFFAFGCGNFYITLNYKADLIRTYFSDISRNYKLHYIQEDKPLGTIGSLYMLKNKLKSSFFVSNCDILIEADYADILKFHKENKNLMTIVVSLKHYTIPYGVCQIKNGGALKAIKEKPEYGFLVNTGFYVLDKKILSDIPKNTFFNITDLIDKYIKSDKKIGIYPISEKSWFDMGQLR